MKFYPFKANRQHRCLAMENSWVLIRLYPFWPFIRVTKRSVP